MLKKYLLLGCLVFVVNVFSQDKTRDEIIKLMAEDTCEYLRNDKSSFTSDKTLNEKQISLGLYLLKSYEKRKVESIDLKDGDLADFEALGEEVGFKMISTCGGEFMAIFSNEQLEALIDDTENEDISIIPPPPPAPKNEDDLQLEADLISLNNDAVSYFQVKDAFDKTHTFLIKEQFEGYKLLKRSRYNKTFNIYYKEIDMFDLSERKYVKKKVVKFLETVD